VPTNIAEDAVRLLYEHLLAMEVDPERKTEKIDLFLYSRGGDVSVPWRIISMFREFCSHFSVLIPFRAHSAATMISLGADEIVMGKKAELSPIDPTLSRATAQEGTVPPSQISVEDVSSYVSFMRERANINDQASLAQVVSQLADHLTPLALGQVNRQYSHIRLVARKLLMSHGERTDEERIDAVIDALTEKLYSHGHAIGRTEAAELGLQVHKAAPDLERLIWNLYQEYEDVLQLTNPIDAEELLISQGAEEHTEMNLSLAAIESTSKLDVYEVNAVFRRQRHTPPNPQINLNVNLGLPPGTDLAQLPANFQQVFQQLLQQVQQELPRLIQQELVRQSPIVGGFEIRIYGNRWKDKTERAA